MKKSGRGEEGDPTMILPSKKSDRARRVPGVPWGRVTLLVAPALVPVRRLPRPSRSIHFGDVSEANGRDISAWTT